MTLRSHATSINLKDSRFTLSGFIKFCIFNHFREINAIEQLCDFLNMQKLIPMRPLSEFLNRDRGYVVYQNHPVKKTSALLWLL